jgi:RNA polymerase sigma-70 factor (ECF subfamily)
MQTSVTHGARKARTVELELEKLVEGAQRGDPESWSAIYREVYPRLVRFAYHRLSDEDEARDAASETMARAVDGIDRCEGAAFTGWLFGICRNVVSDCLRERYRRPYVSDEIEEHAAIDVAARPDEEVVNLDDYRRVRAAFCRLEADEREVLEMRVVAGMSSEQVALALGKRAGAVRMAQMRATSRLRTFLD